MSVSDVLRTSLSRSMSLYEELVASLDETVLVAKLPGIPSNTVGGRSLQSPVSGLRSPVSSLQSPVVGSYSSFRLVPDA